MSEEATSINSSKVPFAVSDSIGLAVSGDSCKEAIMPREEAMASLNEMFRLWKVTTDSVKQQLFNDMLLYAGLNAPSPRGEYGGVFKVAGHEYRRNVIYEVLRDHVRRFFRFYADETARVFEANPRLVAPFADAKGYPSAQHKYSFDFAEHCTGLTQNDRAVLKRIKDAVLGSRGTYNQVKTAMAAKPINANVSEGEHRQNVATSGGGRGNEPEYLY